MDCCGTNRRVLKITWQRLIEGKTCERCSETEIELEKAISRLNLNHLGSDLGQQSPMEQWGKF